MGQYSSTIHQKTLNHTNAVWLQGEENGIWVPALGQVLIKCGYCEKDSYIAVYLQNQTFHVYFPNIFNHNKYCKIELMKYEIKRFAKAWENFQNSEITKTMNGI